MSQYRPTVGIEPINEYEKTKQDVITAYKSFHALSSIQQEKLAKELFGAANVATILNIIQQTFKNH